MTAKTEKWPSNIDLHLNLQPLDLWMDYINLCGCEWKSISDGWMAFCAVDHVLTGFDCIERGHV